MSQDEPTASREREAARPVRVRRRNWLRGGMCAIGAAAVMLLGAAGTAAVPAAASPAASETAPLPGFHHGRVAVDGGYLHYVRGGSGPALVLLHGWPETWWEWHKVMPELAKNHTVVAFDLPGLGRSSVPPDGYDAATVAARVHQGVAGIGLDRVGILAHDLGVLVGYAYARDFPDGVSRIAVLDSPLNAFGLEQAYGLSWHFQFNQTAKPVPENIIDDAEHVRTYLGWLFGSARHPGRIDQERYFRAYSAPDRRSAGFEYYRAFPENAADNRANAHRKLTMPVLAMGAQYAFGPAVAESFRAVATDVRQVVAPDSGHWIPEENAGFLRACATLFFGPEPQEPPAGDLASCAP
ncbi:alpha/beta fold hydrolase [Actinomadura sediminis]|uniref:Alpha/beta fold hydrolase n=1 Tax=Actinomadura sediminis TaxID=1038904 RepID=A0ABW3EJ87_9ACTN